LAKLLAAECRPLLLSTLLLLVEALEVVLTEIAVRIIKVAAAVLEGTNLVLLQWLLAQHTQLPLVAAAQVQFFKVITVAQVLRLA
jgi:hypothetical protein